jgi:hypothetical protein
MKMAFFARWVARNGDPVRSSSSFNTQAGALDFACDMLRSLQGKAHEFWIEDEHGNRVMIEPAITMHCRSTGRLC